MPTPAIQTLINDAQQVLNLDSISAVRSVVAVSLANANTGTPLNPNLTTQQLWNEFYQVVTRSKSDIESIIANQLMKFLFSPPAPGGVGANGQVIFNNNGVLAGDNELFYNPTTNTLTTEKLIVPGNTQVAGSLSNLYVGSILNPTLFANTNTKLVGVNTASPAQAFDVASGNLQVRTGGTVISDTFTNYGAALQINAAGSLPLRLQIGGSNAYEITSANVHTWQNVGGVAGTAMTLNATGLGVGGPPAGGMLLTVGATSSVSATANALQVISNKGTFNVVTDGSTNAAGTTITYSWANGGQGPLIFRNAAISNVMTLDASGNCGIGVTPSGNNRVQVAGNIGLPNTCTASGETSGVFSIDVANLLSVAGGLNVRRAAILMTYVGVDGTGTNPTTLQTLIVLEGFNTWATISKNDIVGTASVAVSGATATSATVTVTVPTGNSGTVHCVLLGGPGSTTRPSMTINA